MSSSAAIMNVCGHTLSPPCHHAVLLNYAQTTSTYTRPQVRTTLLMDSSLLGCDAELVQEELLWQHFTLADEGTKLLRNVTNHSPSDGVTSQET
jgi:hypothetical protein